MQKKEAKLRLECAERQISQLYSRLHELKLPLAEAHSHSHRNLTLIRDTVILEPVILRLEKWLFHRTELDLKGTLTSSHLNGIFVYSSSSLVLQHVMGNNYELKTAKELMTWVTD